MLEGLNMLMLQTRSWYWQLQQLIRNTLLIWVRCMWKKPMMQSQRMRKALNEELEQLKTKKTETTERCRGSGERSRIWPCCKSRTQAWLHVHYEVPTVCGKLWSRSWLTFRHLTCSWKVSSSSAVDTPAAIELLVHTVHSADSYWAVNIKYCIWCKLLISQDPVTELARLFWVHWSTLIQQQLLHLGLFTVMQLHW